MPHRRGPDGTGTRQFYNHSKSGSIELSMDNQGWLDNEIADAKTEYSAHATNRIGALSVWIMVSVRLKF